MDTPIRRRAIWTSLILVTLLPSRASAQMDSAEIYGIVADRSGHSVDGVLIVLVDNERNLRRTTRTNASGFYIFTDVKPGNYRMQASSEGFQTYEVADLRIIVQLALNQNFTMVPGSPSEPAEFKSTTGAVNTTGAVATDLDRELVGELPLNGRSFQTLFQLVPGVVIAPTTFASQGQFAVNGQRTDANYFVVDGVSGNVGIAAGINPGQSAVGALPVLTAFGGTNSLISTEDVQEFAILTSSYPAEFGHSPGAQISIVSRAGTNQFHGTLFNYLRNEALDANDWFSNRAGLPRAALRQNDFGGVLGGPLRKSGTFFFASVEGLALKQPSSSEDLVPSVTSRSLAPMALRPFLNAYPLPNGPEQGNGLAQANYSFSNPSTLNAESFRLDHQMSRSLKVFARYVYSSSDIQQRGADSDSLSTVTDTHFALQTLTAGIDYSVTPHVINDTRLNVSQSSASSKDQLDDFGGAVPLSPQLVFPPGIDQQNGFFQFIPALSTANPTLALGRNVDNVQRQLNLLDNFSYQIGMHLLETGLDFRNLWPEIRPAAYEQQVVFPDVQSVLTGISQETSIAASVPVHASSGNYSAYFEDSWRPVARISLQYGARWEFAPVLSVRGSNGLRPFVVQGFDNLSTLSLIRGSPLYRSTWNNFAPRLGFVYTLRNSERTQCLIRIGGGIFYDSNIGVGGDVVSAGFSPFTAVKVLLTEPFPLTSGDASPPALGVNSPFSVQAFPAVLKMPYTYQWNFSIEQALGTSQSLSIGEVSAIGHSLLRTENYTGGEAGVPSAFTQILLTDDAGYSNYNSLQIKFQRQAGAGVHLIASYDYSHSLDNVSSDAVNSGIPLRFVGLRGDYGSSDFDVRHTAVAGLNYSFPGARNSGFMKTLISGWSADSDLMMRSSPPVDVTISRNIGFGAYNFRPDLIPGMPLYLDDPNAPGGRRINTEALAVPVAQRQGNLGRNYFRGFPLFQEDLAAGRDFPIAEHITIQARIEAFNVLNHPNFSSPQGQLGTVSSSDQFIAQGGFGISQSLLNRGLQSGSFGSGFSPLYQIGGARTVQVALKMKF